MKKKLVFLCQRWTSGGIESLITKIAENLDKDKFEIEIICSQKETNIFDNILKENNVKLIEINNKKTNNPLIRNIETLLKLKKYLKKINPDIIHINIYNSMSNIYSKIARECKIEKIILHAHNNGFDKDEFKIKIILNNICKMFYYNKKISYIAASKEAAKFCFNKRTLNNCKIIINGIDLKRFYYNPSIRDGYRREFNLKDKIVVGHVGRMVPQKNHQRLLSIFEEICKINDYTHLLLIGDGPNKENLLKKIKEANLEQKVTILSDRKDINKLMQAMDCFVFPSLYEGFGIVAIEAQTSGLPTFIADNLSELIFASNNSYSFSLKNSDKEIAKKIIDITKNHKRKSIYINDYSIDTMIKELENIYK